MDIGCCPQLNKTVIVMTDDDKDVLAGVLLTFAENYGATDYAGSTECVLIANPEGGDAQWIPVYALCNSQTRPWKTVAQSMAHVRDLPELEGALILAK